MNAIDRVTEILRKARIAGGWIDEDVAQDVLRTLGLDDNGSVAGSVTPKADPDAPDQSGEPDDRVSDGWVNANSVRS